MEPRFGRSLAHVRVHDDTVAAASADRLGARAYALGSHIVFGRGQYAPASPGGRSLLAHELAHVVHHGAGKGRGLHFKLKIGAPDDAYEREADRVARHVMRAAPPSSAPSSAPAETVRRACGACEEEIRARSWLRTGALLQRACAGCGEEVHDELGVVPAGRVQRACAACDEEIRRQPLEDEAEKLEARAKLRTRSERVQRMCTGCEDDVTSDLSVGPARRVQRACTACEEELRAKPRRGSGSDVYRMCSVRDEDVRRQALLQEDEDVHAELRSASSAEARRMCAECEEDVMSEELRQKTAEERDEELRAKRAHDGGEVSGDLERRLLGLRTGGRPLPSSLLAFFEPRFGRDFGAVRLHTGPTAAELADGIGARAFALGNHIAFARGEYRPHAHSGRELIAHELTHTAQQGHAPALARAPPEAGVMSNAPDVQGIFPFDQIAAGAEAAWDATKRGARVAGGAVVDAGEFAVDTVVGVGRAVISTIEDVADWVMEKVRALARVLGGHVSFSGGRLIITVPRISGCSPVELGVTVPLISAVLPLVQGGLRLADNLYIQAQLALLLAFEQSLRVRLGPCEWHGMRIVIDPLSLSATASSGFGFDAAVSYRAAASAGLGVDGQALLLYPRPPTFIFIPSIQVAGEAVGIAQAAAAWHIDTTVHAGAGITGFGLAVNPDVDVGVAADVWAGGVGSVGLGGQEMCRFTWPVLEWSGDAAANLDVTAGFVASLSRRSLTLGGSATLTGIPYDSIPAAFALDEMRDACIFCSTFYDLGIMPSQNGSLWNWSAPAHLPWSAGPLGNVHQRDPRIASGSLCRGACGPNCETCSPNDGEGEDKIVCENVPAEEGSARARHRFWRYPSYVTCNTHPACRDHDSCYDWCDAGLFVEGLMGPCHRMCDLECLCGHGAPECVGWIGGQPPYDGVMDFSGPPELIGECDGPCPSGPVGSDGDDKQEGPPTGGSSDLWEICLDPYPLFGRHSVAIPRHPIAYETERISLFDRWILTKIGVFNVEAFAGGRIEGQLLGTVGPASLDDLCLFFNPVTGEYGGRARVRARASLTGVLRVSGALGASVDYMWVFNIACAEGLLEATGTAEVGAGFEHSLRVDGNRQRDVDVGCEGDGLSIANTLKLFANLKLGFGLAAFLRVRPLGGLFGEWDSGPIALGSTEYRRGFESSYTLPPFTAGIVPALAIAGHVVDLDGLLDWLFEKAGLDPGSDPGGGALRLCTDGEDDDDDVTEPPELDGAPTGERTKPIPMIWFTPKHLYPQTLTLAVQQGSVCATNADCASPTPTCMSLRIGGSSRNHCVATDDYPLDAPTPLPNLTRGGPVNIGVGGGSAARGDRAHYPSANDGILLEMDFRTRGERTSGAAQTRFRNRMRRHGYDMAAADEQADHVVDSQWWGADNFKNLWPLDASDNTNGGNQSVGQEVTFQDVDGTIHTLTITTIRNDTRAAGGFGGPGVPIDGWFIVVAERDP